MRECMEKRLHTRDECVIDAAEARCHAKCHRKSGCSVQGDGKCDSYCVNGYGVNRRTHKCMSEFWLVIIRHVHGVRVPIPTGSRITARIPPCVHRNGNGNNPIGIKMKYFHTSKIPGRLTTVWHWMTRRDAFRGQSRSSNVVVVPFDMLGMVSYWEPFLLVCYIVNFSQLHTVFEIFDFSDLETRARGHSRPS